MQAFFVKIPSSDGIMPSDGISALVTRRTAEENDKDNNYERKQNGSRTARDHR
jgi:hypothetical protein